MVPLQEGSKAGVDVAVAAQVHMAVAIFEITLASEAKCPVLGFVSEMEIDFAELAVAFCAFKFESSDAVFEPAALD